MGDVDLVGQQVLGLVVAGGLDPAVIFGAVVAHHRGRVFVEAFDLEARLVPDREADRPERAGHALLAQPVLGGGDQRRRGFAVERFEHAPIADALAHMLLHEIVDLRADPPDDLAAALGQPELGRACSNHGFLPGVIRPWTSSFSGGTQCGSSL